MEQNPTGPTSESAVHPPKKSRGTWFVVKWITGLFLLLGILIVLANFRLAPGKGSPLVTASPPTTWITSPLKPNGEVDYVAFLNQRHSLPPDQNAMADLVWIIGPRPQGATISKRFFDLLGVAVPPASGDYLENLAWEKRGVVVDLRATVNGRELDSQQVHDLTLAVPFADGQFPAIDKWIEENQHHILAVRDATRKPGYYSPIAGDVISTTAIPYEQDMQDVARTLRRSSMNRLGKDDIGGAIDDQLAILRLGRLLGNQGLLVDLVLGTHIAAMGHEAIRQTVFSGKCSAEDLARLANELELLPEFPVMNQRHVDMERVMALDMVISLGRFGPIPWEGSPSPATPGSGIDVPGIGDLLMRSSIDWEVVCREQNDLYDRIGTLLQQGELAQQVIEMRILDAEEKEMERDISHPVELVRAAVQGRSARGKLFGDVLAGSLVLSRSKTLEAGLALTAQNRITKAAISIQRFRIEQGKYPDSLAALVPKYTGSIPIDPCSGQALVYSPDAGDPFLLYSIGPNGTDEGGSGDDLSAVPKFRTVQDWIKTLKQ